MKAKDERQDKKKYIFYRYNMKLKAINGCPCQIGASHDDFMSRTPFHRNQCLCTQREMKVHDPNKNKLYSYVSNSMLKSKRSKK